MKHENKSLLINSVVSKLNHIKKKSWIIQITVMLLTAIAVGSSLLFIWAFIRPSSFTEQLIAFTLGFGVSLYQLLPLRKEVIKKNDLLTSLEMRSESNKISPLFLKESSKKRVLAENEWKSFLDKEVENQTQFEKKRITERLPYLALPLLIAVSLFFTIKPQIFSVSKLFITRLLLPNETINLIVIEGHDAAQSPKKNYALDTKNIAQVKLLEKNLIRLNITTNQFQNTPVIFIKEPENDGAYSKNANNLQSFQMTEVKLYDENLDSQTKKFTIEFSIAESSYLLIPIISNSPLAYINVKRLPIPKVTLNVNTLLKELWSDDKPLPLQITVKAQNPLQKVSLIIRSGKRESKEITHNILNNKTKMIDSSYDILLEPYMEQDIQELEIIAEAIDRSTPTPLIGYSHPINVKVASAYGRYQLALDHLRSLKQDVDSAISENKKNIDPKSNEHIKNAIAQASDSPYFDAIDRIDINKIKTALDNNIGSPSINRVYAIQKDLNDFLFEHETLDDRERDRDFFIAARGLSRVLEEQKSKRYIQPKDLTDRIKSFLTEREIRWNLRTKRLPKKFKPKSWPKILKQKPFHKAMDYIKIKNVEDKPKADSLSLEKLSLTVADYRSWIEELELAEDQYREAMEKKRQKTLSSARNEIKELQKRQGKISKSLDQAQTKSQEKMSDSWPSSRMKQQTNLNGTKNLEAKMRAMAPEAAERLKAANDSMKQTLEMGNKGKFVNAESHSDLAGRLLHQANKAVQRKQKSKGKGRRQRRRRAGDQQYGRDIMGTLEIKREYEVDKRYREDILNEVRKADVTEEEKVILDSYLRKVIR